MEIPELNPSGLLLMRVFFQEIIAAGDDASFMEVCVSIFRGGALNRPSFRLYRSITRASKTGSRSSLLIHREMSCTETLDLMEDDFFY